MKNKIEQHPTLLNHAEINDICKPLQKFNISYFCHVKIHNKIGFSAIANNPKFHIHYLSNEHYNADIHMAKEGLINNYFLWDLAPQTGKSQETNEEAAAFGVKHVFTIVNRDRHSDDYYHFATHLSDPSINQTYMNNIDLLNLFTLYFNKTIKSSSSLSNAYNIQFNLNHQSGHFDLQNHAAQDARELFSTSLRSNPHNLTSQQTKILAWLHQGKTVHDIAKIMNLAEVTVNKHIANIKTKIGCFTQFQLGEFFSRYYLNTKI